MFLFCMNISYQRRWRIMGWDAMTPQKRELYSDYFSFPSQRHTPFILTLLHLFIHSSFPSFDVLDFISCEKPNEGAFHQQGKIDSKPALGYLYIMLQVVDVGDALLFPDSHSHLS